METKSFREQLEQALQQAYVWEKQHPADHLKEYALIHIIDVNGDTIMQIMSLQVNYNYGFTIYSFINPNHPVWLSPIGMMFGQGNGFNDNGEQTLICPPDVNYIVDLVEQLLRLVCGATGGMTVKLDL